MATAYWWKPGLTRDLPVPIPPPPTRKTKDAPDKKSKTSWFSETHSKEWRGEVVMDGQSAWRTRLRLPVDDIVSLDSLQNRNQPKRKREGGCMTKQDDRIEYRTKTCKLILSKEQKKKLKLFMGAARLTYNRALQVGYCLTFLLTELSADLPFDSSQSVKEKRFPLQLDVLRSHFVTKRAKELPRPLTKAQERRKRFLEACNVEVGAFVNEYKFLSAVPVQIREGAVRDLVKVSSASLLSVFFFFFFFFFFFADVSFLFPFEAFESNQAKKEIMASKGKKLDFQLKYRSRKVMSSWTISIDARSFNRNLVVLERPKTRKKVCCLFSSSSSFSFSFPLLFLFSL